MSFETCSPDDGPGEWSTAGGDPDEFSYEPSTVQTVDTSPLGHTRRTGRGDGNEERDVFVRILVSVVTVRASWMFEGVIRTARAIRRRSAPMGVTVHPVLRQRLFHGSRPDHGSVYVRDLGEGITVLISQDADGGSSNGRSFAPSLAARGHLVSFESYAGDLLPGRGDPALDVFLASW